VVIPEVPPERAKVINLMDALEASLKDARKKGTASTEVRGERRRAVAAARTKRRAKKRSG
jgi:non-homologous end joining protein Ku